MDRVYIIAEAGVNHNGSRDQAEKLIDCAADAGADAVKFQTFDPDSTVTRAAKTAEYQNNEGYTDQLSMLSSLVLGKDELLSLKRYSLSRGIDFLSTAFDLPSVELLKDLGQKIWKIPSGEITNIPLIEAIGACAEAVILSTGMANLGEIEQALNVLDKAGMERDNITVLHCNTEYPTPFEDVNLRAMNTLGASFGVCVGYSDHTTGIEVPIAAASLGAEVIEKHFTLDKDLEGPDHKASLDPEELKAMVQAVRNIEQALGQARKEVTVSEERNKKVVRKGLYAAKAIRKGEPFSPDNTIAKRPEHSINAGDWYKLMGVPSSRDYQRDDPIVW